MVKYIDDYSKVMKCGKKAYQYYYENFRKEIFMESLLNHLKGESKDV